MKEKVIVSLTTWKPRFGNIPVVLDSIFGQTLKPDLVVLNLADDVVLPDDLRLYLQKYQVELNYVPNTKVYKKLIPTLLRYPDACVISIDDDFLYPQGMIEDFMEIHSRYPEFPISGNRVAFFGMQTHCGCASLTKAEFFGDYLTQVDDDLIANCPSDDIVYTFLANKAGHPYIRTKEQYFYNLQAVNPVDAYSSSECGDENIEKSYKYLVKRYGENEQTIGKYANDPYLAEIIEAASASAESYALRKVFRTLPYKIGNFITKPILWLRKDDER